MGRFFDAISSILGICDFSKYEAQAAMELQAAAERKKARVSFYKYEITCRERLFIDHSLIIRGIVRDIKRGISQEAIALKFHHTIARITVDVCERISKHYGITEAALSGGVFQNRLLAELIINALRKRRFSVYTNHQVPPNDGGISLGQAAFALKN